MEDCKLFTVKFWEYISVRSCSIKIWKILSASYCKIFPSIFFFGNKSFLFIFFIHLSLSSIYTTPKDQFTLVSVRPFEKGNPHRQG